MEPERWRRVEELYHSSLRVEGNQRAAFLKDACHGDLKLCEEVESLLAYESSAKEFMETPAFELAAKQIAGDEADENQADPVPIGATLQRFRVIEKLGVGGMGVVYKAEDTRLHRTVALKFLPKRLVRDPASLERFEREAHSASALNHPNICTVYDVGDYEGQPFIAMELLEGQTLDRRIAGQALPTMEWLTFGIQITEGLHAAHQKGIIHRDIKPANIFVTSQSQAKILDFGLAKLLPAVTVIGADSKRDLGTDGTTEASGGTERQRTPDPFLSRTGVAMGTAGYMSPEQARGEKLDVRTDLFSFGLVLYEMATGKRAFSGGTGPELRAAILSQVPQPARALNPKLPARFDEIVRKALEKDRAKRYQSAAELNTDLQNLRGSLLPKAHILRWLGVAAGILAVLLVSTVVWIMKRPSSVVPNLKLRQLTTSSADNRVLSGAISPDGKYLVYTDSKGLHIQSVANGEERTMSRPDGLTPGLILEAAFFPWFPDNRKFIVNAHLPGSDWTSQGTSIWVMPVSGGAPRKLRDDAAADSISPDGSLIAFTTYKGRFNDRELWVMGPEGEEARKVVDVGENSWFYDQLWSADSRRILYERFDGPGTGEINASSNFMIRDVKGDSQVSIPPSLTRNWQLLAWLPDGRLIVSVQEQDSDFYNDTCNLWSMRIDPRSGKLAGEPKRLTDSHQFCIDDPTVNKDGKQLSFLQAKNYATVYMADVEDNGTRLRNPRHFTLSETYGFVYDWSADANTFFFGSFREGYLRIYKQALGSDTPELVSSVQGVARLARVSPDGNWILGVISRKPDQGVERKPQLVRIPTSGGDPQIILQNHPVDGVFCARPPSNLCAVAELSTDHKQVTVVALDPVKGLGQELARFDVDSNDQYWNCDISPDGTNLAITVGENGPIRILSLRGLPEQRIRVKKLKGIRSVDWAGDGKGFFVSAQLAGTEIWHVDLRGNAQILWTSEAFLGESQVARPSPDGRHLAIQTWATSGNMWMMENF